jgi:hypothetical protein
MSGSRLPNPLPSCVNPEIQKVDLITLYISVAVPQYLQNNHTLWFANVQGLMLDHLSSDPIAPSNNRTNIYKYWGNEIDLSDLR